MTNHPHSTKTHPPGSICVVWEIEDVKTVRPDLTDEQCAEVLEHCLQQHDTEIGINWMVLDIRADELFPESDVSEDNS